MLWKDASVLPSVPFAVGIWYQQSNELIPVGVVRTPVTRALSVGEFLNTEKFVSLPLAHIVSYLLNRMAAFNVPTLRYNNAEEDRIARAVMWVLCSDQNVEKLKSLEKAKESEYSVGEAKVNIPLRASLRACIPPELEEFRPWVNDWIQNC